MGKRYFVAVSTDSGTCLIGCNHKHQNVMTAAACISEPGGYVVAVRRGKYFPLTEAEESEFKKLMYGQPESPQCENAPLMLKPHAANPR